MNKLTPENLQLRRLADYDVMTASLRSARDIIPAWTAHPSRGAAEVGRTVTRPAETTVYEVSFRIKSPASADRYATEWRARIDASCGSYPGTEPEVTFISPIKPWLPHVSGGGSVCLGDLWTPTRFIAHLVVDLAKMLNFDESRAKLRKTTTHYNPPSIDWWERAHQARRISHIVYPEVVLPAVLAMVDTSGGFGPPRKV